MKMYLEQCPCKSGKEAEAQLDARNIFLCYTCPDCHDKQMGKYRPEILTGYDQSDVDEPIEPDDGGFFGDD